MPQGSETAWLYSSSEGRKQLAASANFRRLVVVTMHRNQEYTDMQAVQSELSPMVMDLAPPAMPPNQQVNKRTFLLMMCFYIEKEDSSVYLFKHSCSKVPFLSVGGNLGWREEVSRGVSELSGEYLVENVRGEDGELYRRLIFLSNAAIVQSESRLVSSNTGQLFFLGYLAVFLLLFLNFVLFCLLNYLTPMLKHHLLVVLSREGQYTYCQYTYTFKSICIFILAHRLHLPVFKDHIFTEHLWQTFVNILN